MLQAAIWDFDGTLYDTYSGIMQALQQLVDEYGLKVERQSLYRLIKEDSVKTAIQQFGQTLDIAPEKLSKHYHEIEHATQQAPQPFVGALETCQAIIAAGGQNFLMTHRDRGSERFLAAGGFLPLFGECVTSEQNFKRKPDPEAINYLVTKHQLDPATTVMIGDRPLDVVAGQNAGVKGCFFDVDQFHSAPTADIIINQLPEIIPYFQAQK
ncbi:HAD-IA family hydrolase [Loigolactobacillus jiayinensis]|uniref:HAD-IA family hydrolase n=1 Tax=Loigolactobacillus jiayinensis TaxID=2486016 RepID=A0ABW1RHY6_9LACO|nr:HAD-IA family hydrolase [Loigolactobacillus jiayinensis]